MNNYVDITDIVKRLDDLFIEKYNENEESKICQCCKIQLPISSFYETERYNRSIGIVKYRMSNCIKCVDYYRSKNGIHRTIKNQMIENSIIQRLRNICEKYYYLERDKYNQSTLESIWNKCYNINLYIESLEEKISNKALSIITEDQIKLKTILTKLNQKIKNYDASKH